MNVKELQCPDCYKLDPSGHMDCPRHQKSDTWDISLLKEKTAWALLQSFYRFKALLLPEFVIRNKRCLNSLEHELIREYNIKSTGIDPDDVPL